MSGVNADSFETVNEWSLFHFCMCVLLGVWVLVVFSLGFFVSLVIAICGFERVNEKANLRDSL